MKPRKIKANNFKVSGSQNHDYQFVESKKGSAPNSSAQKMHLLFSHFLNKNQAVQIFFALLFLR